MNINKIRNKKLLQYNLIASIMFKEPTLQTGEETEHKFGKKLMP